MYDFFETSCQRVESLNFSSETLDRNAVFWYHDETLAGVRQIVNDKQANSSSEIVFYFKAEQLYMVVENVSRKIDSNAFQSTEYLTIFEDDKAITTWKYDWSSGVEEDALTSYLVENNARSYSLDDAFDMLNHTGQYELFFHDFLVNEYETYVMLETHGDVEFITALKVEKPDDLIALLYENISSYKGKPLHVRYETVYNQGWTYNYYVAGMLKEN
jgi:hypothetical protein